MARGSSPYKFGHRADARGVHPQALARFAVTMARMANWQPLRDALRDVEEMRTFDWDDLDTLVGGLPASATKHRAFWSGVRSGWPGFTTTDAVPGRSVTFVRVGCPEPQVRRRPSRPDPSPAPARSSERPDIVLVGCVKSKRDQAAPAKDLYVSDLFGKARRYAEGTAERWYILSAQYGLVVPDEVIEPYELHLAATSTAYRREWGIKVARQLLAAAGGLEGRVVEVHAGAAYTDAIRAHLLEAGARVVEPLAALTLGQRLAWYGTPDGGETSGTQTPSASLLVARLEHSESALTPQDFLATRGAGFGGPGLYSWWVDDAGAHDLTEGLGHRVDSGLIYAGLAGATRSRTGKKSSNTLWGRIRGMHLGGRHNFSTFRRTLGAVLAAQREERTIDEERLTTWMYEHLRVIAIPVADADALDQLETRVLGALDPPLNLAKMPRTPIRDRLTDLRRRIT